MGAFASGGGATAAAIPERASSSSLAWVMTSRAAMWPRLVQAITSGASAPAPSSVD
jgi:hypothetical protein